MSKKKLSNEQKLKRQVEILKAQVKASSGGRSNFNYMVGKGVETAETSRINPSRGAVTKNVTYDPSKVVNSFSGVSVSEGKTIARSGRKDSMELPIQSIKKDLTKTTLFAIFSIGFIIVLHLSGVNLIGFIK